MTSSNIPSQTPMPSNPGESAIQTHNGRSNSTAQSKSAMASKKNYTWWQWPAKVWDNTSIRGKITTLLVTGAVVPVVAVTQGIVEVSRQSALNELKSSLQTKLLVLNDAVSSEKQMVESAAITLAQSVSAAGINVDDATAVNAQRDKLNAFVQVAQSQESDANFYVITDAKGRTVAQSVQMIDDDFSRYSPLPSSEEKETKFRSVPLSAGIALGDIAIVQNAITAARPLSGVELVKSNHLRRLGLSEQANIGVRSQSTAGLTELQKPYPPGTFDVDSGKIGLVLMSVQPIRVNNKVVGTAIVGELFNRNYELVDRLKASTGVPTATLFAQDWRVSTNVPYADKATRAIGTRVSKAIADAVLKEGKVYNGNANIIGVDYLTSYGPLYDHQQQLDPKAAKPIGITYVGAPQTQTAQTLQKITITGYAIGGSILLLVVAVLVLAPTDASISRPLRRLTEFADQVASGEPGVRLEDSDRQDEIGVLSRNLNDMAENIDANLAARREDAEQQRQKRENLEAEIYKLVDDIEGATTGDLTVRARLDSLELSTVADLFNAIIESLRDTAVQVKQSTGQVSTSLTSNEQAILQLADQAINEAEEIRNTLDSVEQMSVSIQDVAENASQASAIAEDAYSTVEAGSNAMEQTVDSILSLRATVGETAKKMKRLGESSQKISQVVALIDEIALKTNLLAINASVEASRAGEQGQGFTVVAEQVGALAEQSAAATKEIAIIVAAIQAETQEVAQAMEIGTSQVVDSTRQVETTKQRLNEVLQKSQSIRQLMQSISQATVSQAETSRTVTDLMQQVTETSEHRSAFSRQVAEAIQDTAQVAKELESTVAQFQVEQEAEVPSLAKV
jgi:methyl-accepting chemotaxis protein PixJ